MNDNTIEILNKKGYSVISYEGGHYIEDTSVVNSISKTVTKKEILLNWLEVHKLKLVGEDEKNYYYEGKIFDKECYIAFEPGIELPNFPRIFEYDRANNIIYYDILYYNYGYGLADKKRPKEEVEKEIEYINELLDEWALTLPQYEQEKNK